MYSNSQYVCYFIVLLVYLWDRGKVVGSRNIHIHNFAISCYGDNHLVGMGIEEQIIKI